MSYGGPPQGLFQYPGINQILAASYTCGHGIVPGIITLRCAPQENFIGNTSPITITYANITIVLQNCLLDKSTYERGEDGLSWTLQFQDRRWQWGLGSISGRYNQVNQDGSLQQNFQRTPQQLATACLTAIGEQGFNVSQMPNDSNPLVEWTDERPMDALSDLCARLGCRIVFDPVSQTTSIWPLGQGSQLPSDGTVQDNSLTADPQIQPDAICVVYGPSRHQNDFLLEGIGLDEDDMWKLLDSMTSKPAGGWEAMGEDWTFSAVNENGRENARDSVWKVFRLVMPDTIADINAGTSDSGLNNGYPVTAIDEVLPIEAEQVELQSIANDDGTFSQTNLPAQVYGFFYLYDAGTNSLASEDDIDPNAYKGTPAQYTGGFTIDLRGAGSSFTITSM